MFHDIPIRDSVDDICLVYMFFIFHFLLGQTRKVSSTMFVLVPNEQNYRFSKELRIRKKKTSGFSKLQLYDLTVEYQHFQNPQKDIPWSKERSLHMLL